MHYRWALVLVGSVSERFLFNDQFALQGEYGQFVMYVAAFKGPCALMQFHSPKRWAVLYMTCRLPMVIFRSGTNCKKNIIWRRYPLGMRCHQKPIWVICGLPNFCLGNGGGKNNSGTVGLNSTSLGGLASRLSLNSRWTNRRWLRDFFLIWLGVCIVYANIRSVVTDRPLKVWEGIQAPSVEYRKKIQKCMPVLIQRLDTPHLELR